MSTISTLVNHGITLGTITKAGTYASPLTITAKGYIDNTSTGAAIYGPSTGVWSVYNQGKVTAANGFGIDLEGGGTVINTGSIRGTDGVYITNAVGAVTNYGSITATGTTVDIGGGPGVAAAYLKYGGGIVNTGFMTGQSGVVIGYQNFAQKITGLVSNTGTILGTGTIGGPFSGHPIDSGIHLEASGTITNGIIGTASNALIIGGDGIFVRDSGTITNFGTIAGTANIGIFVLSGKITNGSSLVTNALITGKTGIDLYDGGILTNFGTVVGGVSAPNFDVTIANYGTINDAINIQGLAGTQANTVTNFGTVFAGKNQSFAVRLEDGGTLTNNAGGVIVGPAVSKFSFGAAAYVGIGTIINRGLIAAISTNGIGVYLGGGRFINYGTVATAGSSQNAVIAKHAIFDNRNLVIGDAFGISLGKTVGTAGATTGVGGVITTGTVVGAIGIGAAAGITTGYTVTVAGTVGSTLGSAGTAVSLGGLTGRLIVVPGAVFTGILDGGGGSSVVEIAAAAGGVAGVADTALSTVYVNLGSVTNFSALQVDPGAGMDAGGNLTFDTLVNEGQINLLAGDSLVIGAVAASAGGGTIDLKSGGTVHFTGPVAANQTVLFRPPGGTVAIDHPEQFAAAITQFADTDLIDLPLGTASFEQYSGGILSLAYGGGSVGLQLSTVFAAPQFALTDDGHGGTDIFVSDSMCFCRGTRIRAERGEVAVEDLAVGDRVATLSGALKPIVWIGMGRDLVTRANKRSRPVIVRRNALADCVPTRDLYLTHGHALYIDSAIGGVLIPVENLINHRTILWDERPRLIEYYHIELEDHDVLLADGAPAESYYDANNRALFHTSRPGSMAGAATPTFAPVLNGGAVVEAAWERLFARSGGHIEMAATEDPDLHLVVAGVRLDPAAAEGSTYSFSVAEPPPVPLRLRSRSGVPSLLGIVAHDHRRLGVAIARIELRQPGVATVIEHDWPLLFAGGCHPAEPGYCWTDGELMLPPRLFVHLTGAFTLAVHLERPGMRYPLHAALEDAA